MKTIRNVVVGIAEAAADPQLEYAVQLASSLGAALHVVHAYHLPDPVLYPYVELSAYGAEAIEDIHRRVQGLLEAQVRRLSPEAAGTSGAVTCRAVPAPPAMAVLNVASEVEADLIIVGGTRHGAVARALLGTTAQRVLRGATAPVLVHRSLGIALRRVLLTTDLSELSARVHGRGVELAALLSDTAEPELRTLLVVGYDIPLIAPIEPRGFTAAGRQRLDAFLDDVGGARRPAARVRVGDPAREIPAEAAEWEAELLVLGTHGRTGASRLLIGSVAESVLRSARCDILVIPAAAVARPAHV
ncbi:MAG: universal stress protein [Gemmatimonadetes bacterium]|nr:universal stress protein [Gemmatimonadota bacterium]